MGLLSVVARLLCSRFGIRDADLKGVKTRHLSNQPSPGQALRVSAWRTKRNGIHFSVSNQAKGGVNCLVGE